jgi:hypothetical protein
VQSNRSLLGHEGVTLCQVNLVLRPNWLVVAASCVCIALIGATPGYLRTGGLFDPLCYGITLGAIIAVTIGQRTVTLIDEGMTMRRSSFDRFFCPWTEVVAVERRQLGPFGVDQLQLREPLRRYIRYSSTSPPDVTWRPTRSKRVFIGLYDRHWRTGPIGAALKAHGVSPEAIRPTRDPAVN